MTVSRHLVRRTARKNEKKIERLLRETRSPSHTVAQYAIDELDTKYGLKPDSRVKTESTMRGPFGFRVVTY